MIETYSQQERTTWQVNESNRSALAGNREALSDQVGREVLLCHLDSLRALAAIQMIQRSLSAARNVGSTDRSNGILTVRTYA